MKIRRLLPGALSVLLGSSAFAQSSILDLSGTAATRFGGACDVVGDVDGDGFGDVVVGAIYDLNGSLEDAGSVTVFSGANGSALATIQGSAADEYLGWSAGAAGDVNGDGHPDYFLGSLGFSNPPPFVRIVSGIDGKVLHNLTGHAADAFGWVVTGVGDVNADGHDDLLVGSPDDEGVGGSAPGSLTVFSGADGSVLHLIRGDPYDRLGDRVGRVGDVDADGHADFAGVQMSGVQTSMVRIFSGATGNELWHRNSGRYGQVSGGIDANGDGFSDFVIGSPLVNSDTGRVQLISGRDNSILQQAFGSAPDDYLGLTVLGAGDLDGDGYGDFAAGIPGFDGAAGANTGAVRAYSGRTGAVIFTLEGDLAQDGLGASLGGGRDVNGDGFPDLIAGAPLQDRAKVISFVPRGLEPFGTGTPACRGNSTLLANGVPTLGNASFALHASGLGRTPVLVRGDTEDTAGTLYFGALFHVDFDAPALVAVQPLLAPDAHGSLVAPLPIPAAPALLGRTFVLQVASRFPGWRCAQRLGTSHGLRLTIQ